MFILINSTCFGHYYAHHQENRLCKQLHVEYACNMEKPEVHGDMNLKFASARQAKDIFDFKNLKRRLRKTTAAIWFNKTCRSKQLYVEYAWLCWLQSCRIGTRAVCTVWKLVYQLSHSAANTTRHTPHAVVYIVCSPDYGHNNARNMLS